MHEAPGPPTIPAALPLQPKLTKYIAFHAPLVALSVKGTSVKNKSAETGQNRGLRSSLGLTTPRQSVGR